MPLYYVFMDYWFVRYKLCCVSRTSLASRGLLNISAVRSGGILAVGTKISLVLVVLQPVLIRLCFIDKRLVRGQPYQSKVTDLCSCISLMMLNQLKEGRLFWFSFRYVRKSFPLSQLSCLTCMHLNIPLKMYHIRYHAI